MKRLILFVLAAVCVALAALVASWVVDNKYSSKDELKVVLNGQNIMTAHSTEALPSLFASCDPFTVDFEGYLPMQGVFSQENTLDCSPNGEFHLITDLKGMKFSLMEGGNVSITMQSPGIIWLLVVTKLTNFIFYSVLSCILLMSALVFGWHSLRRDYY
ncbi:hypothetical protein KA078_00400 [Candidatus Woesebacteria bacterium]|nr:hypothetical protein [Candidatus Woesebacteria bacterium]